MVRRARAACDELAEVTRNREAARCTVGCFFFCFLQLLFLFWVCGRSSGLIRRSTDLFPSFPKFYAPVAKRGLDDAGYR